MATSRGRQLEAGACGRTADDLPPLPDTIAEDPASGWVDPRAWFDTPDRPLEIEIGSGKGTFLVQQAASQPGTNFLGIEYAHEYWLYAADRVRRHALDNVRMLYADASDFLRWRTPDACARVLHLYFPDPWPKKRHHKRRMVCDAFLADAWRVLEPGGELRIVTDHDGYWEWMQAHFARWAAEPGNAAPDADRSREEPRCYERLDFARPPSADEGELVGTNFERKYREEGRPFHATILRKPA